jgi:hypothetical protein
MGVLYQTKVKVPSSEIHGKGVFATHSLSRGEIVLPLDDSRIVDDQHPPRLYPQCFCVLCQP